MIKLPTKEVLSQNLKNLIKDNTTLKILKKDDLVFVNNKTIKKHGDYFVVNRSSLFFRKKSAVAYAVCLEVNNQVLANKIQHLDRSLAKLNEDYFWYIRSIKNTNNEFKKINLYNRISDITPRLKLAKIELNQTLKSVKIA